MLKIFCLFGWHTWTEIPSGTKRTCDHCHKKQHLLHNGKDSQWCD